MKIYAISYKLAIIGLYTAESIKSLYDQLKATYSEGLPDGIDIIHIGDIDGRIVKESGYIIKPYCYYDEANHMNLDKLRELANAPEEEENNEI